MQITIINFIVNMYLNIKICTQIKQPVATQINIFANVKQNILQATVLRN